MSMETVPDANARRRIRGEGMTVFIDADEPRPTPLGLVTAEPHRTQPPTEPAARRPPRRRWPWWIMRAVYTIWAVSTFLQAVFAGRFLAGEYPLLFAHQVNGIIAGVTSAVACLVTLLAWWIGGAPGALALINLVLAPLGYFQVHFGFARNLGVHIPLGVIIITSSIYLAAWVWRHRPGDRLFR
jgi:hypothetical protein